MFQLDFNQSFLWRAFSTTDKVTIYSSHDSCDKNHVSLERLSIIYIHFSPDAIDFSVCNAVQSFKIDEFKDGKVFEEGLIVAFSAGELNAQGFGKERTNNWNGMNIKNDWFGFKNLVFEYLMLSLNYLGEFCPDNKKKFILIKS